MKKFPFQILLMITAILGLTGFQLFWLKQTYSREEKSLAIKSEFAFRDAIENLQVSKLKLDKLPGDSLGHRNLRLIINDSIDEPLNISMNGKRGIISTINVIRKSNAIPGSKDSSFNGGIVVTKDQLVFDRKPGMPVPVTTDSINSNKNHIFRFLYGVDSLQGNITIKEIDTAFRKQLTEQHALVPFTILKLDSNRHSPELAANEVTVGFAHPVTFKLELGNTFPYLIRQIGLPVLFSIFLLGITILSFLLLNRNLIKQRRLTEFKNQFIGNITHELKTPIATVSVAIEAMKNFNALQNPERTREYLDISANELQRLSLLVDKVLSLSKFEQNEIEIKKEKFDLLLLVKEVMDSMKLQFEKQHAVTVLEITGNHFIIEADHRHISSVIYNLLDNALKYSLEAPHITIHLIDKTDYLEIQVIDKGIGIAKEYQQKIFDQFFRVPSGDKHNIKGYGLGLSYVNYIVTSHHGLIEVESEPGKGSSFIVKLPVKDSPVNQFDNNRKAIKESFKL